VCLLLKGEDLDFREEMPSIDQRPLAEVDHGAPHSLISTRQGAVHQRAGDRFPVTRAVRQLLSHVMPRNTLAGSPASR